MKQKLFAIYKLTWILLLGITCGVFQLSCTPESKENKSTKVYTLDPTKTDTEIKLSEFMQVERIVKLQSGIDFTVTANDWMLATDKYIIIRTAGNRPRLMEFSIDGKYIRDLANPGKGPNEILRVLCGTVDNKNQIYYFVHRGDPHKIWRVDLDTGEHLRPIPVAIDDMKTSIFSIALTGDTLVCFPSSPVPGQRAIMITTRGEKVATFKTVSKWNQSFAFLPYAQEIGGGVHFLEPDQDTIFTFKNDKVTAAYIFNVIDKATPRQKGNKINKEFEGPSVIAIQTWLIDPNNTGFIVRPMTKYMVNKNNGSIKQFSRLYIDSLGISLEYGPFNQFSTGPIDVLAVDVAEFKNKIKTTKGADITPSLRTRIDRLDQDIKEEDNPILLLGHLY